MVTVTNTTSAQSCYFRQHDCLGFHDLTSASPRFLPYIKKSSVKSDMTELSVYSIADC